MKARGATSRAPMGGHNQPMGHGGCEENLLGIVWVKLVKGQGNGDFSPRLSGYDKAVDLTQVGEGHQAVIGEQTVVLVRQRRDPARSRGMGNPLTSVLKVSVQGSCFTFPPHQWPALLLLFFDPTSAGQQHL